MTTPRILYFDCFSGIAGDMTLGALIDLGVDAAELDAAVRAVPLGAWRLKVAHVVRSGIRAVDVKVEVDGHGHGVTLGRILELVGGAELPQPVRALALAAYRALGAGEARVHGCAVDDVHFHEVGAVDSIVDIVGSAWGVWRLGVDRVESAPPPLGRGFVDCSHGRMPLPAPATLEILRGRPITSAPVEHELVTPTGASFVAAWADGVGPIPDMVVEATGWGAGDADFEDRPNLLRLVLGRGLPATDAGPYTVLEANLDDASPELAGYLLERLLAVGARDAWFAPLVMKKGRPGFMVGALADAARRAAVEDVLLAESTTLGLRRHAVSRLELDRACEAVDTPFGPVPVKVGRRGGQVVNVAPEHEACAALARAAGVPLKTVYQQAVAAYYRPR